ncbi:MAG: superoxide dismutase family protein [Chromatiales bacterium]|jgi:Cu-Zn family superoxide dismutase
MHSTHATRPLGVLAGLLLAAAATGALAGNPKDVDVAMATINGCEDKNVIGTALLHEIPSAEGIKQVEIYMVVRGLSDGDHAVHIHETAACEPCGAAKGHHDPGPFGKSTPDAPDFNHPYHMGDLVNIKVENGVGVMHTVTNRVTLSPGRLSILDKDGSAFIIHTGKDTYCDHEDELNKGCAGGARDACGIIRPLM